MPRASSLVAVLLCLFAAWPAAASRTRDGIELLKRDMRELRQLLEAERVRNQQLEAGLAELRRLTGVDEGGRMSAADLSARLDGLDRDVQVIFENQNESKARLSVLTDKLDALFRHQNVFGGAPSGGADVVAAGGNSEGRPSGGLASSDPSRPLAPPVPESAVEIGPDGQRSVPESPPSGEPSGSPSILLDPEQLHREARADYERGDHALAIEGFEEFLRRFPDSELADNALYWIGESHLAAGEPEKALISFDAVLQRHPSGDKAPDAGLKRGLCLLELNRMADGIIQLQHVKDAHPGSAASQLAREKLESLGLM